MTGKVIRIVRHGETELNRLGIIQGRSKNPSLNARGKLQSMAFFHTYKHIPFDVVYTSTLKRSIESVQPFIDTGIPHYTLPGLDEIDWGKQEGKEIAPEIKKRYNTLIKQWRQGQTDRCIEGGESPVQVAVRQHIAIQTLLGKHQEKQVLVCMHGRAMRILLCQLLHYPLTRMDIFEHTNSSLYVIRHTGSMCYVSGFNDTTHLNGIP